MSSAQIRDRFLSFFRERGHEVVASSSLVPAGDQTLLFANAGMNQFKDVFTGKVARAVRRATTAQKCVRAGGKHNDLENVGETARHHTFFEMLGNFSFGDYFKEQAIAFAWELLTTEYRLDPSRLYITVHESDDEAEAIWRKVAGSLPAGRIVRMGDKDNFWAMGPVGPCGPCSEILVDQGPETGCRKPGCDVRCSCDRHLEIWNLVFMQYEQKADGSRAPLPRPSIDTGMGLERLSGILAGRTSNYDTDLFMPLIEEVARLSGKAYDRGPAGKSHRVLADHTKAAAFLVCDGIFPTNEGRGYVLRRIMRRAARHAYMLGLREPTIARLLDTVLAIYRDAYPALVAERARIQATVAREEEKFLGTIAQGIALFDKNREKWTAGGAVPGAEVFSLYDTYGFPTDLTEVMAREQSLAVDMAGFEACMEEQRKKARGASMFKASQLEGMQWTVLKDAPQGFVGYGKTSHESAILRTARSGGGQWVIVPEACAFYAESGGQVGDTGEVVLAGNTVRVTDTRLVDGFRVLVLDPELESLPADLSAVHQQVDAAARRHTAIHHSCTHLLHQALREVLGKTAEQRGSWVGPTHLRFDFPHPEAVSREMLEQVEERVNALIRQDLPIAVRETSLQEATKEGVTALFGEKYGERVRVVEMGDGSKELCGGTHLERTGVAAAFVIRSESAVASGVRRIEALAGPAALAELRGDRKLLRDLCRVLQVQPAEAAGRLEQLRDEAQDLRKEGEKLRGRLAMSSLEAALGAAKGGVLAEILEGVDGKTLRKAAEEIRARHPDLPLLLGASQDGKAFLALSFPEKLAKERKLHAGQMLKELAALVGGGGGGAPLFAQAGGSDPAGLPKAVALFREKMAG